MLKKKKRKKKKKEGRVAEVRFVYHEHDKRLSDKKSTLRS